MLDYYKILKIETIATEAEIKKAYRKLAIVYHPDKNNGSSDSEEMFKIILNAYTTLSDKQKKREYDIKYKEYIYSKENQHTQTQTNYNYQNKQETNRQERNKPYINYNLIIFFIIVILIWLISRNETTTGNINADHQLEEQKDSIRPPSGELNFK